MTEAIEAKNTEIKDGVKMVEIIDRNGAKRYEPLEKGANVRDLVKTLPVTAGYKMALLFEDKRKDSNY